MSYWYRRACLLKYDENQPRDKNGRWVSLGADGDFDAVVAGIGNRMYERLGTDTSSKESLMASLSRLDALTGRYKEWQKIAIARAKETGTEFDYYEWYRAVDSTRNRLEPQLEDMIEKERQISESSSQRGVWDTPKFKEFFGDSKAVDPNGNPLRLYHGTPRGDIDELKPDLGGFIYMTENSKYASIYSNPRGAWGSGSPNILPLYLRAERPLDMTPLTEEARPTQINRFLRDSGIDFQIPDSPSPKDVETYTIFRSNPEFRRAVESAGYDSLKIVELYGGSYSDGGPGGETPSVAWVTWTPSNIKSALGNDGNYDRSSPKLTKYSNAGLVKL